MTKNTDSNKIEGFFQHVHDLERDQGQAYPAKFILSLALIEYEILTEKLEGLGSADETKALLNDVVMLFSAEAEKRAGNLSDSSAMQLGQEVPGVIARIGQLRPDALDFGS